MADFETNCAVMSVRLIVQTLRTTISHRRSDNCGSEATEEKQEEYQHGSPLVRSLICLQVIMAIIIVVVDIFHHGPNCK